MKEAKITIKGKEYLIKQSFRVYMIFEEMSNKQVSEIKTIRDMITLMFCTFKANNKDFEYTFEEFIDIIDEDITIFDKFNELNVIDNKKK